VPKRNLSVVTGIFEVASEHSGASTYRRGQGVYRATIEDKGTDSGVDLPTPPEQASTKRMVANRMKANLMCIEDSGSGEASMTRKGRNRAQKKGTSRTNRSL